MKIPLFCDAVLPPAVMKLRRRSVFPGAYQELVSAGRPLTSDHAESYSHVHTLYISLDRSPK